MHANVKERSWGGLWRREADENEDRSSLAGLWANRAYWEDGAARGRLLDAVRPDPIPQLRSRAGGSWLPAFPGPGWPIHRYATARPIYLEEARP